MKHIFPLIFLTVIFGLLGCASTGDKLGKVSIGMTKAEVIGAMGKPTSVSASDGTEIMHYSLNAKRALWNPKWDYDAYYVRLINGKVESYGKLADLEKATLHRSPK